MRNTALFFMLLFSLVVTDQALVRVFLHRPQSVAGFFSLPPQALYWFVKDTICWMALLSAPFLAFCAKSKWFYKIILPPFAFSVTCLILTWIFFNMQLDGDWVGMLLGSSSQEIAFFAQTYITWKTFTGIAALCLFLYFSTRLANAISLPCQKRTAAGAVALFCVMMPLSRAFTDSPSIFFIVDTISEWTHSKRLARLKLKPKIPEDIAAARNSNAPCRGVFILGESATRNHWSLYGYGRKTTPEMDALRSELIVFSDVVTPVCNTTKAMELIFTHSTMESPAQLDCTYAQMLKAGGMGVSLYSSHSRWGRWDGVESFIFSGCEPLVFLDEENLDSPWFDDSLLKYLDRDIASTRGRNHVTILHLRGSHFPADTQYPAKNPNAGLAEFIRTTSGGNADTNSYDTSIIFTDMILGETVKRLKNHKGPAWMIYLSDHGDSIGAGSWRLVDDRNVWEVPMVVWFNREYEKAYPDTVRALAAASGLPLQSDMLLPGFLHIAGLKGWQIDTANDFLNKDFKLRSPRIIEGGKVEYAW